MTFSLQGKTILVTRPADKGLALCEKIAALGGLAIHFPTIVFQTPDDLQALNAGIAALAQQDWLIFVSENAVLHSIRYLQARWPQFPPRLKLACIGKTTAQALIDAGYSVHLYPELYWDSEHLLALSPLQHIKGQRITIMSGEGGRDYLATELQRRGAIVNKLACYRRELASPDKTAVLTALYAQKITAIMSASFETVKNLKTLLIDEFTRLGRIPLIVPSARIEKLAEALHFQTIWVANNADHLSMLEKLHKQLALYARSL